MKGKWLIGGVLLGLVMGCGSSTSYLYLDNCSDYILTLSYEPSDDTGGTLTKVVTNHTTVQFHTIQLIESSDPLPSQGLYGLSLLTSTNGSANFTVYTQKPITDSVWVREIVEEKAFGSTVNNYTLTISNSDLSISN